MESDVAAALTNADVLAAAEDIRDGRQVDQDAKDAVVWMMLFWNIQTTNGFLIILEIYL